MHQQTRHSIDFFSLDDRGAPRSQINYRAAKIAASPRPVAPAPIFVAPYVWRLGATLQVASRRPRPRITSRRRTTSSASARFTCVAAGKANTMGKRALRYDRESCGKRLSISCQSTLHLTHATERSSENCGRCRRRLADARLSRSL
jgi:hypothetical protein